MLKLKEKKLTSVDGLRSETCGESVESKHSKHYFHIRFSDDSLQPGTEISLY